MKILACALTFVLLACSSLTAQSLEPMAWFARTNNFSSFAVWGEYVYAATTIEEFDEIGIYSIAGGHLDRIRSFPLALAKYQTVISAVEGYLFISLDDDLYFYRSAIAICDLSDPLAPVLLSQIPLPYGSGDGADLICYCPPYLYCIYGSDLLSYDMTEPRAPLETGRLTLNYGWGCHPNMAQRCGELAVNDCTGIRLIDVSDPAHPRLEGCYRPPSGDWPVIAVGNLAVAFPNCYRCHPQVIDISDPWAPAFDGEIPYEYDLSTSESIGFDGRLLAGQDTGSGYCHLFDLSDPRFPWEISRWTFPGEYICRFAGDMLVILGPAVSVLIDVSQPDAPVIIEQQAASPNWLAECSWDSFVALSSSSGYTIYSLANPAQPTLVSSLPLSPANLNPVLLTTLPGLVAAAGRGLSLIDVSDPQQPRQLGFLDFQPGIFAFAAANSYVYFTPFFDAVDAIHIADVRDPDHPVELAPVPVTVKIHSLACRDDLLYAGCFHYQDSPDPSMILIYDLSSPSQPELIATIEAPEGQSSTLALSKDRLFAVDGPKAKFGYSALSVYDLREPRAPALLGVADAPPEGFLAAGSGLVVHGDTEIRVYDANLLPTVSELGAIEQNTSLIDLTINTNGFVIGLWKNKAGIFKAGESFRSFIGGWRTNGLTVDIEAWTPHPGVTAVELTYDGVRTGVFLTPMGDGSFRFEAPLSGVEQSGQYLIGLRGEGADVWRPNWPYFEVE